MWPFARNRQEDREAERGRLLSFPRIEPDPQHPVSGVLLRDEIEFFANKHHMIEPFDAANLKPAAYELTVGSRYAQRGRNRTLGDGGSLTIEPFGVAVVQTAETLNIPVFMVARWNIKVSLAYAGLLWVGGPQVDPGWVGRLSCPVYNLSAERVRLERGQPLAVIDFVVTSQYRPALWAAQPAWAYQRPPKRVLFDDYHAERLLSGVAEKLARQRRQIARVSKRVDTVMAWGTAAISLLVAALAVMSTWKSGVKPQVWHTISGVSLAASIAAIVFAALAAWRR